MANCSDKKRRAIAALLFFCYQLHALAKGCDRRREHPWGRCGHGGDRLNNWAS